MRERNIKNKRNSKIPHALGKKSLARKAHEMVSLLINSFDNSHSSFSVLFMIW